MGCSGTKSNKSQRIFVEDAYKYELDILFANSFYKLHFEVNNILVVEFGSCSLTMRKFMRNTTYLKTVLYSCTQTFQRLHSKQNKADLTRHCSHFMGRQLQPSGMSEAATLSIQLLIKRSAQTRTSLYFPRSSTRLSAVLKKKKKKKKERKPHKRNLFLCCLQMIKKIYLIENKKEGLNIYFYLLYSLFKKKISQYPEPGFWAQLRLISTLLSHFK